MKTINYSLSLKLIFVFAFLFIGTNIFSQEGCKHIFQEIVDGEKNRFSNMFNGEATRNSSDYDLKYHKLEWTVDPAIDSIAGAVLSKFEVVTSGFDNICFSLEDNMILDSVSYHNSLIPSGDITHSSNTISIDLPGVVTMGTIDSIKLFYHGKPSTTGFGSFETNTECGEPVMWTLSEPFGARRWWPCKQSLDDKIDSIDVIVTTPSAYKVASNGVLISNDIDGTDIIYHWKHKFPIPAYLIAIAIADYTVYSDFVPLTGGDQIEILNYAYSCNATTAMASTPYTIDAMILFDSLFGLYPFADEKYGHAEFGWGGGMEHQTMSFMGGYSEFLISHELAHQWFGDKVTCADWQHIWLNEGWATYSEGLTHEAGIRSGSNFNNWLQGKINHVIGNSSGSVHVPISQAMNVGRIFNSRLSYSKGALLLHMLRWKLGDTDFFNAVNNYLTDNDIAFDYALTAQFQDHLEMESGLDLDEFFDDWFYGEGWPTYNLVWSQDVLNNLHINVLQLQSHASVDFFEIPIPLFFTDGVQDTTIILDPSFSGEDFTVQINFEASSMTFDPENWILANNSVVLPLDLTSFIGKLNSGIRELKWTIENPINVSKFNIQRSFDRKKFKQITTIDFKEDNNNQYYYIDKESCLTKIYYYRLEIEDLDGTKRYSDIIALKIENKDFDLKIVPNPVHNQLDVITNSNVEGLFNIMIYNSYGKLVKKHDVQNIIGDNEHIILIDDLPIGIYSIQFMSLKEIEIRLFTKI